MICTVRNVGMHKTIARFFLAQQTKTGRNTPKWPQKYQMTMKYTQIPNDQKCTRIFHAEPFKRFLSSHTYLV
jgi:3'-phosphoadenosine 5'-phosphosulfate sulfotransferase (PAPS reductase)/FAD synthetase